MTYAPPALLAARALLLSRLDMHPGAAIDADLDPSEVGIVGDTRHGTSGYHVGYDRLRYGKGTGDYSYRESRRDAVKSDAASALDIGRFRVIGRTGAWDLCRFSAWLVAQCQAGAPDTRDIREVIYSPDGRTVRRWDRLGIRSTGDSTHLYHTHISYFRDSESRDKCGLFRRFFAECLDSAPVPAVVAPEDELTPDQEYTLNAINYRVNAMLHNLPEVVIPAITYGGKAFPEFREPNATYRAPSAPAPGAGIDPGALAAAVADEVAKRLAT